MGRYEAPHTYREWVDLLEVLKEGNDDEGVIAAFQHGELNWQTGVASRFYARLADVVNTRLNRITDTLQRDLNHARGGERDIVGALVAARRALDALLRAVDIPALPERERNACHDLIVAQADSIQQNLEESSTNRSMRTNRLTASDATGRLASIIRNNPVNSIGRR